MNEWSFNTEVRPFRVAGTRSGSRYKVEHKMYICREKSTSGHAYLRANGSFENMEPVHLRVETLKLLDLSPLLLYNASQRSPRTDHTLLSGSRFRLRVVHREKTPPSKRPSVGPVAPLSSYSEPLQSKL